jgi:TPR repeat protein
MLRVLSAAAVLSVSLLISTAASADMAQAAAALQKRDFEAAFNHWLPLAEDGNRAAQHNLGQLYRLGKGVPRNFEKAAEWYLKAAELWYAPSQYNLALLYENGLGVPINYEEARYWYEKAANQDYGIAQFNLAVMLSIGQGVKPDYIQAHKWYDIAAEKGMDDAAENRDLLALQMSKEQVDKAQELAREWILWRKSE